MNKVDTITGITSRVLEKYRNSIPRKAFIDAMDLVKETVIESAKIPTGDPVPGITIIKNPDTAAEQLADLLSGCCPPFAEGAGPVPCDETTCRDCWLAWLTTGKPGNNGKEE